jgi:hypothetical protein
MKGKVKVRTRVASVTVLAALVAGCIGQSSGPSPKEYRQEDLAAATGCQIVGSQTRSLEVAERNFECALGIRSKLLEPTSRELVESLLGLAQVRVDQCRLDEAQELLERARSGVLAMGPEQIELPAWYEAQMTRLEFARGNYSAGVGWFEARAQRCGRNAIWACDSYLTVSGARRLRASREPIATELLLEVLEQGTPTERQKRILILTIHEVLGSTGRREEADRFARAHGVTLLEGHEPWPTTPLEEPARLCTRPRSNSEATADRYSVEAIDDCIDGFKVTDPARSPMLLVTALVTSNGETAAVEVKGLHADPPMMECALRAAEQLRINPIEHGFRVVYWSFVPG